MELRFAWLPVTRPFFLLGCCNLSYSSPTRETTTSYTHILSFTQINYSAGRRALSVQGFSNLQESIEGSRELNNQTVRNTVNFLQDVHRGLKFGDVSAAMGSFFSWHPSPLKQSPHRARWG